jgi:amino acid transporter
VIFIIVKHLLTSNSSTSGFISWICCCIVYLRFRKACLVQSLDKELIPYHSFLQPVGAWIAIVAFVILTLINGFDVFFTGRFTASSFLTAYVGIPIFLVIYFGHRAWHYKEAWVIPSEQVDLHTGIDIVLANETPEIKANTWQKKLQGLLT